jgi:hypothetical protein
MLTIKLVKLNKIRGRWVDLGMPIFNIYLSLSYSCCNQLTKNGVECSTCCWLIPPNV